MHVTVEINYNQSEKNIEESAEMPILHTLNRDRSCVRC